jgi:Tol biopolymer transport system component
LGVARLAVLCVAALVAVSCGGGAESSGATGELVLEREDGVYALDLVSGEERAIGPAERYGGVWSPSGTRAASGDGRTIVLTDVTSGASERFAAPECLPYAWSPDDATIACRYSDPWTISTFDPQTRETRTLTDASETSFGPSWSPDSRSIAYAASGIMVMNRDGSHKRRLARGYEDQQGGGPAWSPDGRRIAFLGDDSVSVVDAEGGEPTVLLDTGGRATYGLAWSPDGRYVSVTHGDGDDYEIFVVDVDAGEARNLTDNEGVNDTRAVWSPDGRHVAYVVRRGDDPGVFVVPVEGGTPDRVSGAAAEILHWLESLP